MALPILKVEKMLLTMALLPLTNGGKGMLFIPSGLAYR